MLCYTNTTELSVSVSETTTPAMMRQSCYRSYNSFIFEVFLDFLHIDGIQNDDVHVDSCTYLFLLKACVDELKFLKWSPVFKRFDNRHFLLAIPRIYTYSRDRRKGRMESYFYISSNYKLIMFFLSLKGLELQL